MTEMEPQARMDDLLRRSMTVSIPSLPSDFEQRLQRKVRRSSEVFDRYRRYMLAGYGLVAVLTSAVVMRGQGLEWGAIAVTTLGPVAFVAAAAWMRRPANAARSSAS